MRRLIIGAVALVTGLLAAGGVALTRRRRGRDEVLPLEPAPPLGAGSDGESAAASDASVEADFGAVGQIADAAPAAPKRKPRVRRKPVKAAEPEGAISAAAAESAEAEARAEAAAAAAGADTSDDSTAETPAGTADATDDSTATPADAIC